MTNLDTALAYAARGWPVFPCTARKVPLTESGFKDASTDETTIRGWWDTYRGAIVGIRTGAAGLVVVDVDVKDGKPGRKNWKALVAELGPELTDTAVTRTQSGGWHYYYRANGHRFGPHDGGLAEAVDVKAGESYVVGYGYWLDGHGPEALRDLPPALAEKIAALEKDRHSPAGPIAEVIHTGEGRHGMLVSLAGSLRYRGLEPEEILPTLLAANARRNDPPYPEAHVRKVAASMTKYTPGKPLVDPEARRELLVSLAGVAPQAVKWIWPRRVPLGMPCILFGDAGLGKTHVALDIVTRVSLGAAWPDGGRAPVGNVVVMSGEDDWATTIVPRLVYSGADLSRVFGFPAVEAFDERGRRTFRLTDDGETLERELRSVDAILAVVDPLTCFLGGVDTHRTSDLRAALTTLADVATRAGAGIVCVLHPNKDESSGAKALNRLSGSGAFGAAARSVMAVASDPQDEADERRLLLSVKLNVAAKPEGIGFRVTATSPDTCDSGIVWDTAPVEIDADEAFGRQRPDTPQMVKAKAFLKRVLVSGEPYPATVAQEEAGHEGINLKTLQRAKKKLGVQSHLQGFGADGVWTWQLGQPEGDDL